MPPVPAVSYRVGNSTLELVDGDITRQRVDAVVNAANRHLSGGAGVDGAIHRAGGPKIMDECRRIGHCPTGKAVATGAGDLPCRWVIHTVGPVWHGGNLNEAALLASAYRESLSLARELGARSVAFPSISTGAYGYPLEPAARVALETLLAALAAGPPLLVRMVLFGTGPLATYQAVATALVERAPTATP